MPPSCAIARAAAAGGLHDLLGLDIEAVGERPAHRHAHDAACRRARCGRRRPGTSCRRRRRSRCRPPARRRPAAPSRRRSASSVPWRSRWSSVTLMQDADRRIERGREIDLIGRHLDHVHAAARAAARARGWRCRYCRRAATSWPAAAQQMRDERGGGRLAVGAGDGDERRVRRMAAALAAEQLDVADHLDRGGAREPDRPVRRRMGERHAGREHQRGELRPVDVPQVGGRDAGAGRLRHRVGIVVPADRRRRRRPAARWRSPARSRRGRTPRPSCRRRW